MMANEKRNLIDQDLLIDSLGASDMEIFAKEVISEAPTVDAVEVVHGRWIVKGQDVFCSHCDKESGHNQWGASAFSDYCPNCGAKMDGDGNDSNKNSI